MMEDLLERRFGIIDVAIHGLREELKTGICEVRADLRGNLEGLQAVAGSVRRLEAVLDRISRNQGPVDVGISAAKTKVPIATEELAVADIKSATPRPACAAVKKIVIGPEQLRFSKDSSNLERKDLIEVDQKLDGINTKLDRIADTVGASVGAGVGNDEEDRKRLKERLKEVLETAQRNRIHKITSEKEKWLEYIFGICRADGRIGKRGSRCSFSFDF